MEPKIESAIEFPGHVGSAGTGKWAKHAALIPQMKIGDSLLMEGLTINIAWGTMRHHTSKYPSMKFAFRTVEGGVRMWRIV